MEIRVYDATGYVGGAKGSYRETITRDTPLPKSGTVFVHDNKEWISGDQTGITDINGDLAYVEWSIRDRSVR